jgi:hypothetical protein
MKFQMERSEVTSVLKLSEGLSNRVSILITRYIDQMKFAAYMAITFFTFFPICFWLYFVSLYIWFILYASVLFCKLCIFMYSYCYVCSVLCILFQCVVLCSVRV